MVDEQLSHAMVAYLLGGRHVRPGASREAVADAPRMPRVGQPQAAHHLALVAGLHRDPGQPAGTNSPWDISRRHERHHNQATRPGSLSLLARKFCFQEE